MVLRGWVLTMPMPSGGCLIVKCDRGCDEEVGWRELSLKSTDIKSIAPAQKWRALGYVYST
jgi:hypothetical protein